MKCPNCSKDFGLFSDELKEIVRSNTCPACGTKLKMGVRHGWFLLGFACIAVPAILFGLSSPIAAGIAGGAGALVGIGLKRA